MDVLHGTQVPDPYRWMENEQDPDLQKWIAAQRDYAERYLASLPGREKVEKRLKALWNYARVSAPTRHGKLWFQYRNNGLQNQSVLYVMRSPTDPGRVLLDPNQLAADGTVAVNSLSISPDGRYVAYALSKAGSDWQTWHIRRVEDGKDLPDRIAWSKFSGAAWLPDGSGFYYARYDAPKPGEELSAANYHQKLFFHKVGTEQSEDRLVYQRPDQPEWGFSPTVTEDGRFLIIHVWKGTDSRNRLFYQDLRHKDGKIQPLVAELEASYDFVDNIGDTLLIQTNLGAPRGRIIAIDVRQPDRRHWHTVVPQQAETLRSAAVVNGLLALSYLKDAR
ncbi:MAG: S9 family peptidase, partial [Gammaproteobacteria bacterium]